MRALALIVAGIALSAASARAEELPIDKLSLEETFQFLTNGLTEQGVVRFEARDLDASADSLGVRAHTSEVWSAAGDAKTCKLMVSMRRTDGGKLVQNDVTTLALRRTAAVRVGPWSVFARRASEAPAGRGLATTPDVWRMIVEGDDGRQTAFDFYDRTGADQAADAIRHAKYLCDARRPPKRR